MGARCREASGELRGSENQRDFGFRGLDFVLAVTAS